MSDKNDLLRILDLQKKAHLRDGPLSLEQRKEWIDRLINSIIEYQDRLPEAISKDFSHRSETSSLLTDVASSITSLKIAKNNIKQWMKPSKRKVSP
ncbi:MAG: coniferyl aldehyde dehydrogenase, partial [Verrucomicrobiota bacterium]|nr:coniferyl aldehyde dehydrogenase [Verrucomicrobiota bacterium]